MIVKRVVNVFQAGGVTAVLKAVVRRIRMPHARVFPQIRDAMHGSVGLEIGGPSPIFSRGGLLPVYAQAARVDNCNFAADTIWEGKIAEGSSFSFDSGKVPGRQIIAEGADLHMVESATYDFVLSSHMLEHTANPLKALLEWGRLLKANGVLVCVVPHYEGTFDHRRPVTTLSHLVDDFEQQMGEDDLTHLAEVLKLHDEDRDPAVHDISFRERAERNPELRSLHHHVFDTRLVVDAVRWAGFHVEAAEPLEPYHVVVLARKPMDGLPPRDLSDDELHTVLDQSPFQSDRRYQKHQPS